MYGTLNHLKLFQELLGVQRISKRPFPSLLGARSSARDVVLARVLLCKAGRMCAFPRRKTRNRAPIFDNDAFVIIKDFFVNSLRERRAQSSHSSKRSLTRPVN